MSWKEAVELIGDGNLPAAAIMLSDPGLSPAGCRTDGSDAEVRRFLLADGGDDQGG